MADGGPGRVIAAGDWHGNTDWAVHVIAQAGKVLAGEDRPLILHAGDFGIWPGQEGADYRFAVSAALDQAGADLWFVDGNHEDHDQLGRLAATARALGEPGDAPVPVPSGSLVISPRIFWLPRGLRWTWHDRIWVAVGGGVSLDAHGLIHSRTEFGAGRVPNRTEGKDWWPAEQITDEQEAAIVAGGHADVMLAHDCPSGVVHSFPGRPSWWAEADVAASGQHEQRLQRITDAIQPGYLIHGHLHRSYTRTCDFGYGPVQVTGLDCDPAIDDPRPGVNWAVLDTRDMTWADPA